MKTHALNRARIATVRLCWLAAVASLLLVFAAEASGEQNIVRVEEDWVLVVASPDSDSIAPQVTCAIFPFGQSDRRHATLELNHQSQPDFVAGGMQLQLWNAESPMEPRKLPHQGILSQAGETVRWTQTVTIDDGQLTFEVIDGASDTWGSFGGQGYLRISMPTQATNLNEYNPMHSVQNSGVGYAGNRVQLLVLNAVRVVTSTDETFEDDTDHVVHLLD